MPTFNTVAERDAYYANKLKTAGVAPQQGNFTSAINNAQTTRTTTPKTTTPTLAQTTAPGADNGAWITTRPITTPAAKSAPSTAAPAASTQTPTQLNIPTQEPSKIESTVTAAQTAADKNQAAKDKVQADYYKLWQQGEEDVKNGIYKTNPYPANYSDYRKQQDAELQTNIDVQKQQNEIANKIDEAQLGISTKQGKSAISGVEAAMAQGRQGVTGTSKPLAATSFTNTQNTIINNATLQVQSAKNARDEAQRQLELAQTKGDAKSAEVYAGQVAQANADITSVQTDLANAQAKASESALNIVNKLSDSGQLTNLSDADIAALSTSYGVEPAVLKIAARAADTKGLGEEAKAKMDNLTSFTDMAKGGVAFNLSSIQSIAKTTGLDSGILMNIAELGQQVKTTKGVEQQKAQADLTSAIAEANQKQRGIFTAAQQNYDYLNNMYNSGASQEQISAFKSAANITDYDDPKYKAELSYKQAEAAIEQAHAEGRAITPDDMVKFANAQEEMAYNNGAGANPSPGGEELADVALNYKTTGDWKSDFKNNKVYQGGNLGCAVVASGILKQAGVLDKKYPSIATLVPALQSQGWTRVDTPQKGDVVVWGPMQGTDGHGHVGICTDGKNAVNNQGPSGPANTPIFYGRTVKPSADYPLAGFYRPPGNVQMSDKPEQTNVYRDTMAALKKQGTPFDVAKEIATKATKDAYSASTTNVAGLDQSIVKSLASYSMDPKDLSSRLPAGTTESQRQKYISAAIALNPDFDETKYGAKANFRKGWEGADSSGSLGYINNAANTALKHLGTAYGLFEKMENSGITDVNGMNNYIKEHMGDADVSAYISTIEPLSGEVGKVVSGGVPTESTIKSYRDIFSPSKTPAQMEATMRTQIELMAGRIKTNVNKYKKNIGAYPDEPVLDEESIKAIENLGLKPSDFDPSLEGNKKETNTPTIDWKKQLGQGVANLLQNNLNNSTPSENPWNSINTTQSTDVLSQFDIKPVNKWIKK